jgi:hypothetical protein
LCPQRWR